MFLFLEIRKRISQAVLVLYFLSGDLWSPERKRLFVFGVYSCCVVIFIVGPYKKRLRKESLVSCCSIILFDKI